jgi:hypothetical protein
MFASGATGVYDSAGNASSKLNDRHIVSGAQVQRQAHRQHIHSFRRCTIDEINEERLPGGEDVPSADDHAGEDVRERRNRLLTRAPATCLASSTTVSLAEMSMPAKIMFARKPAYTTALATRPASSEAGTS